MKSINIKNVLGIGILLMLTAAVAYPQGIGAATNYRPITIVKRALDTAGYEIEAAEPGQRIVYEICFQNINNSAVTSVSLVDELPNEVSFIEPHIEKGTGVYNSTDRTFTWLYGSMAGGESVCLELVVEVKPSLAMGKIISNFVWIECNETSPSSSVLELPVGLASLRAKKVNLSPNVLELGETVKNVTATVLFPDGITQNNIDLNDKPALYYQPQNTNEFVFVEEGSADLDGTEDAPIVSILFDREKLMDVITGSGQFKVRIKGKLKSGQIYYGDATINIDREQGSPDNVSIDINMEQIWDYNDPADESDLTYEFRLRIEVADIDPLLEKTVTDLQFITPAGKTFQIPKKAAQWWGKIWTSYEYDAELQQAIWQYRVIFTKFTDLQIYGDGQYTFIITYKDGSQNQTSVWFGIPGTTNPIPQPTQEPILTFPLQNQTAGSPVTFTWKPCTDESASEVGLQLRELEHGDFREGYVDADKTSWGPVIMTDGSWQADLIFQHTVTDTSQQDHNVFFSFSKSSRSRYNFTVTGYPRDTYEVWGGESFLDGYADIDRIQANGYVKLGESDGETATFSGEYAYYLIATRGQFALNSIQGTDDSYYSSFISSGEWDMFNITNENNLLGPPDGKSAIVGTGSLLYDDDYSGYIAFTNPGKWKELTVIVGEITPTEGAVEVESLRITPNVLRRNGSGEHITAVIRFPEGITQNDIDLDDEPELYYQDRDTKEYILIGKASSMVMSGTENRPAITAYFSRSKLMNKVPYYGGVNLKIEGNLNGQPYYGFATIHITIFAGD